MNEESRIDKAKIIIEAITSDIKHAEDPFSAKEFIEFAFNYSLNAGIPEKRSKFIASIVSVTAYKAFKLFQEKAGELTDDAHKISLLAASGLKTKCSACEQLCAILMIKLMKSGLFDVVGKIIMTSQVRNLSVDHVSILIHDEENNAWVLDPLFKIICQVGTAGGELEMINNYIFNEKIKSYFFEKPINFDIRRYPAAEFKILFEEYINRFLSDENLPDLKEVENNLDLVRKLETDFAAYFKRGFKLLRHYFIDKLTRDKEQIGEIAVQIINVLERLYFYQDKMYVSPSALVAKDLLLSRVQFSLPKNLVDVINTGNYSLALRIVSNSPGKEAFELVEVLFEFEEQGLIDFDINAANREPGKTGRTALHNAAANNKDIYDFLLNKGANPDLLDNSGNRASDYLPRINNMSPN